MTGPEAPLPVESRITVPRSARYYTLGGERAAEAWIVLHGMGQLAARFLQAFRPVATPDRLILAPEALNHYYTNHRTRKAGALWMTSEDRLAQIADYVRYLDLVWSEVTKQHTAFARVEVHGFSQGAQTAVRWVAMGQVPCSRLVLWGGGVPHDLDLAKYGAILNAADLTLIIGDRDEFITEERVQAEVDFLQSSGLRYTMRRFRGGHVIPWPLLQELAGIPAGEQTP